VWLVEFNFGFWLVEATCIAALYTFSGHTHNKPIMQRERRRETERERERENVTSSGTGEGPQAGGNW
jgi:hypothetical protein